MFSILNMKTVLRSSALGVGIAFFPTNNTKSVSPPLSLPNAISSSSNRFVQVDDNKCYSYRIFNQVKLLCTSQSTPLPTATGQKASLTNLNGDFDRWVENASSLAAHSVCLREDVMILDAADRARQHSDVYAKFLVLSVAPSLRAALEEPDPNKFMAAAETWLASRQSFQNVQQVCLALKHTSDGIANIMAASGVDPKIVGALTHSTNLSIGIASLATSPKINLTDLTNVLNIGMNLLSFFISGGADPDVERHKQVMEALGKLNEKLNEVHTDLWRIFEALDLKLTQIRSDILDVKKSLRSVLSINYVISDKLDRVIEELNGQRFELLRSYEADRLDAFSKRHRERDAALNPFKLALYEYSQVTDRSDPLVIEEAKGRLLKQLLGISNSLGANGIFNGSDISGSPRPVSLGAAELLRKDEIEFLYSLVIALVRPVLSPEDNSKLQGSFFSPAVLAWTNMNIFELLPSEMSSVSAADLTDKSERTRIAFEILASDRCLRILSEMVWKAYRDNHDQVMGFLASNPLSPYEDVLSGAAQFDLELPLNRSGEREAVVWEGLVNVPTGASGSKIPNQKLEIDLRVFDMPGTYSGASLRRGNVELKASGDFVDVRLEQVSDDIHGVWEMRAARGELWENHWCPDIIQQAFDKAAMEYKVKHGVMIPEVPRPFVLEGRRCFLERLRTAIPVFRFKCTALRQVSGVPLVGSDPNDKSQRTPLKTDLVELGELVVSLPGHRKTLAKDSLLVERRFAKYYDGEKEDVSLGGLPWQFTPIPPTVTHVPEEDTEKALMELWKNVTPAIEAALIHTQREFRGRKLVCPREFTIVGVSGSPLEVYSGANGAMSIAFAENGGLLPTLRAVPSHLLFALPKVIATMDFKIVVSSKVSDELSVELRKQAREQYQNLLTDRIERLYQHTSRGPEFVDSRQKFDDARALLRAVVRLVAPFIDPSNADSQALLGALQHLSACQPSFDSQGLSSMGTLTPLKKILDANFKAVQDMKAEVDKAFERCRPKLTLPRFCWER